MSTFRLSDMIITDFYSVNRIHSDNGSSNRRKERKNYGLVYKFEGKTEYLSNGNRFFSCPDTLVILPRKSSYDWCCMQSGSYFILEFDAVPDADTIRQFHIASKERVLSVFQRMYETSLRETEDRRMSLIKDTYELLLILQLSETANYHPSEKSLRIMPAVEYLSKNLAKPIKNEELAALCGMSTVYFRKTFTEIYGVSPIHYLNELRIEKAKAMLQSDFGSVSDIAESLGYTTIYHFSQMFKRKIGVSPITYAKNVSLWKT